jgi:hypothetical protein
MSKSKNEIFIEKAIKIHGDKYDYSKVNYIKSIEKVIIICYDHKDFLQTPKQHLSGQGCHKCVLIKMKYNLLSNNKFIENAIKIHANKFDYSKVIYINSNSKVIIICKNLHEFKQTPNKHLSGRGCLRCSKTHNTDDFIKKSKLIHKNKYDYSKVKYISSRSEVIIICKSFHEFKQMPNKHLSGHGCPKCCNGYKYDTNEFIRKAKLKHGDIFDYSKVNYITSNNKIIILCKKFHEFEQLPSNHLFGYGCPKCSNNSYSKSQIQWLELLSKINNIKIQHALNDGEFTIPNTKYKADGYCKENNTIYEFHGDYWHGNPNIFNPNDLNTIVGKTYSELYENTLKREQEIKDLGYNLEIVWENDWNKLNKSIKKLQKQFKLKN